LIIAEGIESSLSAQQAAGTPAWAGVSAAGLAALALPALPLAAEVIIMADPDEAGRRAASAAAARWHGEGRTVRIALPDPGTDANDLLQARP
jgi:putative DNA primase/helicase